MVSSLTPDHVINLATSIPEQAIDRSAFTDRTPPLEPCLMHRVPPICLTLSSIFNLLIIFFPMLYWVDDVFNIHG
jgi:hypothetical protein